MVHVADPVETRTDPDGMMKYKVAWFERKSKRCANVAHVDGCVDGWGTYTRFEKYKSRGKQIYDWLAIENFLFRVNIAKDLTQAEQAWTELLPEADAPISSEDARPDPVGALYAGDEACSSCVGTGRKW